MDPEQKRHLDLEALHGVEIVDVVTRLCAMNLMLHGIGSTSDDTAPPVETDDSLRSAPSERYDVVLTNPPFGKKSSITVVGQDGQQVREQLSYEREDFWATASNRQLNFVQHIFNLLKINCRAAVVVPDNVLFEGGAAETVRHRLLQECDVHTLLRLPTGIFYAQGVKASVIFFERKPGSEHPWTRKLWIYDLRTNKHFTLKTNPLARADLKEFEDCHNPANRHDCTPTWSEANPDGRWRCYDYDDLIAREKVNVDIFWLRDESLEDSANLPETDVLTQEIIEDLRAAPEELELIQEDLAEEPALAIGDDG
jgi:type I restriction enzyme M protein